MSANIALPPVTEGIEPGPYEAELATVEEVVGQYGEQFKLWWNLVDTDAEQIASFANKSLGPKAKLRAICEALLGRELTPGEQLHTKDILRKHCTVVVDLNDNGYPKISAYTRLRKGKTPRQAAIDQADEPAADGEEMPF